MTGDIGQGYTKIIAIQLLEFENLCPTGNARFSFFQMLSFNLD
jgi:hypothetical protein